jgi:hypothetical protein
MTWQGENPFYLLIRRDDNNDTVNIDLDERGWVAKHADWMRAAGRWFLIQKGTAHPVLAVVVHEGDQPYYTARHVGVAGSGGSQEVTVYGIGAKRLDGRTDRLWWLPNGTVCSGDDESALALSIVYAMGPK